MNTLETGEFSPRDYQWETYEAATKAIRSYKGPVFVTASVAAGKTLMMSMIAKRCSDVGMSCLILARQGELISQTSSTLWKVGVKNSIYSASLNSKSTTFKTVAATEGTFYRALYNELKNYSTDVLLVDESHMVSWEDCLLDEPETQYGKIIKELQKRNPKLRIIGYTGSPYRSSEFIKGAFWVDQISDISTEYLVGRGYLKPTIFGFGHDEIQYDLSEFKSTGEQGIKEFSKTDLIAMQKKILKEGTTTQKIMIEVQELTKDRGVVMVTCAGRKHCEECVKYLPENSYGIITDQLSTKQRTIILDKARTGEIKYLVQIACLTTGLDLPRIDTIVILRNIGSLTLLIQLIGRGLRTYFKSKKLAKRFFATQPEENQLRQDIISASTAPNCLVLDYSSTMESLGELYQNPILEDAQLSKGKFKAELIDCPSCATKNSQYARRCIGDDNSSADGRCEFFWQFVECHKCTTKNDTAARFCRAIDCQTQLIDPNKKLTGKHYSENDFKIVKRMTMTPTNCGNGLFIGYSLEDGTFAKEIHWPFSQQKIHRKLWRENFLFKHVKGLRFRKLILDCRSIGAIVGQKAVFDVPLTITANEGASKIISVRGKRFRSGREETNETI